MHHVASRCITLHDNRKGRSEGSIEGVGEEVSEVTEHKEEFK